MSMDKKRFTDLFINRPVLAIVVSCFIFIFGIRSYLDLQVRQYPKMDSTVITITTSYPGAPASLVQGFITSPIEKVVGTAEGIDYMTSQSTDSTSTIQAFIKLNFDPNKAFVDVMSKVQQVKGDLPTAAQEPVILKSTGSDHDLLYVGFNSDALTSAQITDYIARVVRPVLETAPGVAEVETLGGSNFAMRIWLNPKKMAAMDVTMQDVHAALLNNNFLSAPGSTKGKYITVAMNANTDTKTPEEFSNLIVRRGNQGAVIHLKDIGHVVLGQESYDSNVFFNGKRGVFIGIKATPEANPLSTIDGVRKILPGILKQMPPSLHAKIIYDSTKFIRASIDEVIQTIFEAIIIVIIVIFAFLGSLRSVLIPTITIPLSMVGIFTFMLGMGYSINLLTLLAMVLAIGLVVDDAIIVVENIYRHVEEGMPLLQAALAGARDIAFPIIAMTFTLAAVYVPIGFMGGVTGSLFKEFAFTLAGAVIISGIIALTLSPMMCAKVFTPKMETQRLVKMIDGGFSWLRKKYEHILEGCLQNRLPLFLFAFVVLASLIFLFTQPQSELAPMEDQGVLFYQGTAAEDANIDYVNAYTKPIADVFKSQPTTETYFTVNSPGQIFGASLLKPWGERKASQQEVYNILNGKLFAIPGLQIQLFQLPPIPISGSAMGIQIALKTTNTLRYLYPYSEEFLADAMKSGIFMYLVKNIKYNKPEIEYDINRPKAAQMGINMSDIANTLATAYGENYVNWFSLYNRSYEVIPQVFRRFRSDPIDATELYIHNYNGDLLPLSTLMNVSYSIGPQMIGNFAQLNAIALMGALSPGHTVGDAVSFFKEEAKKILPRDISYDYMGQTRLFVNEGASLTIAFIFSLIVIYLVLAAQFESFIDPLVVMISVPMAICGALLPLNWGLSTLNIYTQIGLITLIGLISKHGILVVAFANKLREEQGMEMYEAIHKAAGIRLRPVLMTTFAMVFGMIPLLIASGPGAVSRFDIGLVIAMGMGIGTLFTLFVLPTIYTMKPKNLLLFLLSVIIIAGCTFYWIILR